MTASCGCQYTAKYSTDKQRPLGIFAAEYATELVCGMGNSRLQSPFALPEMRTHLERCLENQVTEPFPHDPARVQAQGRRRKVVHVAVNMSGVTVEL